MNNSAHPLDLATALVAMDEDRYTGRFTPAYANMVGPFGGVIAASMLNAVLLHPQRMGEPAALTVNFAGPISDAEFQISARPSRSNRSTQHWNIELLQDGEIAVTATALLAVRREGWSAQELAFPEVPAAEAVAPTTAPVPIAWVKSYQMRFIDGLLTMNSADSSDSSLSLLWVRDEPARTISPGVARNNRVWPGLVRDIAAHRFAPPTPGQASGSLDTDRCMCMPWRLQSSGDAADVTRR